MSAQRLYPIPTFQRTAASSMEEESAPKQNDFAPNTYCRMLKGDAKAALFLNQIVFHQHSQCDEDGWYWHTAAQWNDELGFTPEVEARCCKTLTAYGLETCIRRVNGFAVKHYRVNEIILQQRMREDSQNARSAKHGNRDKCNDSDFSGIRKTRKPESEKHGSRDPQNTETYKDINSKEIDQRDIIPLVIANGSVAATASTPPENVDEQKEKSLETASPVIPFKKPKEKKVIDSESPAYQAAIMLHDTIHHYAPKAKIPDKSPSGLSRWVETMRLMLERDHRTLEEIKAVLHWLWDGKDKDAIFWQRNIFSADKFRAQFDRLTACSQQMQCTPSQERSNSGQKLQLGERWLSESARKALAQTGKLTTIPLAISPISPEYYEFRKILKEFGYDPDTDPILA